MERLWECAEKRVLLRVARWLACPDRPAQEVPGLPSYEEIQAGLEMEDSEKVREALDFCKGLFEREEERTRTLESKAITLTGFTGLTTAFVSGFAALLLDAEKIPCEPVLAVLVAFYVLVVYSFVRTILCALRVVRVGAPYWFASPEPRDILRLKTDELDEIRRERAVDFFHSYVRNHAINDDKAGYLISAQRGFAIATLFLFSITMVFAGYALLTP